MIQAKDKYNQSNSIKFQTESIKSSLYDYSDAFILVTGDITVNARNDTDVAYKNYAPIFTCKTEIDDVFVNEAHVQCAIWLIIVVIIQTHQEVYCSLKDEVSDNNADLTINNSQSLKYKAALVGKKTSD